MLLYIALTLLAVGWWPGSDNSRGNELYKKEKYPEALQAYRDEQNRQKDNPTLHYNMGNALYRQEKYDEAARAYQEAIRNPDPIQASAYYNLGNSLYRMGQLKESIEAYKQGLRIDSRDVDMKYNLEFVQRKLQEQEQQKKSQPDQNEDEGEPDKNEDDGNPDQNNNTQNPSDSDPSGGDEKDKDRQPQQQPRQGQLSREDAERLLNALNQDEQDLQKSLRKQGGQEQSSSLRDW